MIELISASKMRIEHKPDPRLISRLDKARDEMKIPWKELNKIAKEVIGREFRDVRFLNESEIKRVLKYLKVNWWPLVTKYRKVNWE